MTNKKLLTGVLGVLVTAMPFMVFAETDYVAREELDALRTGQNNRYQIKTLRASGNGTIGGALTVVGTIVSSGGTYTNGGICVSNVNGSITASNLNTVAGGVTTINGTFAATAASTMSSTLAVGGALTVTATGSRIDGAATIRNLTVTTNAIISGTTLLTGVATLTAVPVLNATFCTNGATTGAMTTCPSTNGTASWVYIVGPNGNKYVIPAFPAP